MILMQWIHDFYMLILLTEKWYYDMATILFYDFKN